MKSGRSGARVIGNGDSTDRCSRSQIAAVLAVVIAMVQPGRAAEPASPRHELSGGAVRVTVEPRRFGMRIELDGIPFSRGSELVVTTPPWTPHFYVGPTSEAVAGARLEPTTGGTRLRIEHRGEDAFVGNETLTLSSDGRTLEQDFEGRFLRDGEALIQWRMAAIDAALVSGRTYTASGSTKAGGKRERVPVSPQQEGSDKATLAKGFSSLRIESRIGPIQIEVESPQPLVFNDARASKWVNPDEAYFWFGDLGTRIRRDRPVRYRVTYRFPSLEMGGAEARRATARAGVVRVGAAQTTEWLGPPRLVPRPKEVTWREEEAVISDLSTLKIEGPDADAAADALRAGWRERMPAAVEAPRDVPVPLSRVRLLRDAEAAGGRAEGYALDVSPTAIVARAVDEAGLLHAVRTLRQMTRVASDGTLRVRCGQVVDWPSLRFRGVHLFTGGRGPELHLRLVRNVLGALKMNQLVLECEYIRWDSHPEIHHPRYGMPKGDVRRILKACRQERIEVTPLINTLGHCQWIFETGHHEELAEDPQAKFAYCVTNPATYEFIFPIFEEALELFRPRFLHIGHDEFADRGRVPYRPESRKFTIEELLMRDTLKLHGWLKERGVRVMMWGDMLLAKGEAPDACNARSVESARRLREQLPDDVLITDWHYAGAPAREFTSLRTFAEAGHEVVAATWNRPMNIVEFARAAFDAGALGLLQTTWAGYSLDDESFANELHQYAAYVLAADAAWNADRPPPADVADPSWRFLDLMGLSSLKAGNAPGWMAELGDAFNLTRAASDARGWFGFGPAGDLSALPAGDLWLGGVRFRVAEGRQSSVIALHGKLAGDLRLPGEVAVDLNGASCTKLVILQATNFRGAAAAKVGDYELELEDGSKRSIELRYGRNIVAYDDLTAVPDAPVVWQGRTTSGARVALRALVWTVDEHSRSIQRLTMRSSGAGPSVLVFAITGLSEDEASEAGEVAEPPALKRPLNRPRLN